ncbi:MAG: hypothetical protein HDQ88_09025 [Clostridia bacterium]|nr:hypothetical protein [Clostridia bacterium]
MLKDVYTAGRGITISDDRVISVDEDAISGVIADDLIEENSGLKVENDKLHLADHASTTPEYGLGDLDHYGHVRLADTGDSRATVQAGIAATPAAVKDVDDRAVHKEGDETITGVKTFVDTPKVTLPDGSTTEVATVDGTVWAKRVDELPEDTDEITANMPEGALVVTPDDGAGSPIEALRAELAALQADVKKRGLYNQEVWITESGEWTAPVTGWYEVLLIGGGSGGAARMNSTASTCTGGGSGGYLTRLVRLESGQKVSVTVGAGGAGIKDNPTNYGSPTQFGVLSSADDSASFSASTTSVALSLSINNGVGGGGFGGGKIWPSGLNGAFWGAGGAAYYYTDGNYGAGDGKQGAIRLRYYDPTKKGNN